MVAGMVMPLADLRSIYEVLFRDGVMVTKKDKRPQCMHPDIQGVSNLKVIRTMGSLKSRGFVRETFAWKHAYFYLTNEGIVYLRDYLHLPAEIVPSSLQRVRRPASTLDVMRRAARVQTVEGPTSYVPKPRAGRESQEAMVERQGYRHKRGPGGEEEAGSDRPPMRFRGSYQPRGPAGEPGMPTQTFFRRGQGLRRGEERWAEEPGQGRGGFRSSYLPPESRAVFRPPAPAREVKPPTPEIPVSVPLMPKVPQEMLVPAAVAVEVFPPALAAPAVIPAVELKPEVPIPVVEEVVELVKAVEPVEQVEIKPTVEEEQEEEEEEESEEEEEDVTEELVEKASAWLEEDVKPAVKELAEEASEEAIKPAEVTEEEVVQAFPVKEKEEEPQGASDPDEEEDEEEEEEVVKDVSEEDSSDEDSLQEAEMEKDIEILEEPKELIPEEAAEELKPETVVPAEEAESKPVGNTEAIEVEAPVLLTTADTPDPESDAELPSPPAPVSDDITDLPEQPVDPVVQRSTHQETAVLVTPETSFRLTPDAVTATEEDISTTTISQSYVVTETSTTTNTVLDLGLENQASFEASFAGPEASFVGPEVSFAGPEAPSECPMAALRTSLPQGDWGFLTEDALDDQEVTKVWPDSLEEDCQNA